MTQKEKIIPNSILIFVLCCQYKGITVTCVNVIRITIISAINMQRINRKTIFYIVLLAILSRTTNKQIIINNIDNTGFSDFSSLFGFCIAFKKQLAVWILQNITNSISQECVNLSQFRIRGTHDNRKMMMNGNKKRGTNKSIIPTIIIMIYQTTSNCLSHHPNAWFLPAILANKFLTTVTKPKKNLQD